MGYGIYSIYRKPIARMPTIPEHEEVYAVNDVWDNEFRMLERMSSLDETDMIDLELYDLVWDKDFGKLVPCEEDLQYGNNSSRVVGDADVEEASKSLRAILDSFERSAAIHLDDDEDEDYEEEYEEDILIQGNSGYAGYSRISCDVVSVTEEEHKIVAVSGDTSSEACSGYCRPIMINTVNNGGVEATTTENIPVADVMRRARSLSNGPGSIHQKQKVY